MQSIPGIGEKIAATIISEIGEMPFCICVMKQKLTKDVFLQWEKRR
ncbi:hypothetical protein [Peribacillus simplex]